MDLFFWRKPPVHALTKPLRGVNLGGWLVLEKWMTPSVFASMDAADEYSYCARATAQQLKRLQLHRDTFITKADFVWIKSQGLDAVRLPVGSWVFGDELPYQSTIVYVDKAFRWAEQTGLKILLDMHGAPGSQNGRDHSGRIGKILWHKDAGNVQRTLEILERLVKRYKNSSSLLGVELLNEPGLMFGRQRLRHYYQDAYAMIRRECGPDVWVAYSDFFPPYFWNWHMRRKGYTNIYADTHHYQTFARKDRRLNLDRHMEKILRKVPRKLLRMQQHSPVIVGEWSLVLPPAALQGQDKTQLAATYRMFGNAQIEVFENTAAWFYWSYKTESGGVWSFRDCIEKGILPSFGSTK